jgi:hypothetical protein
MIYVKNKYIPFGKADAMTVWPFVLYKRDVPYMENHETIHGHQQVEFLLVALMMILVEIIAADLSPWWLLTVNIWYYLWYLVEWLVRWAVMGDRSRAYRAIAFEQEAYAHQRDDEYPERRMCFEWARYLFMRQEP